MRDEWYGASLQTEGMPMVDSSTGRPLILRTFEYTINPKAAQEMRDKKIAIDKQQLFNSHWAQIRGIIWSDGLVASTDVNPRIVIGKKRYRIFILCEPKFRVVVAERPKSLQDVFKKE